MMINDFLEFVKRMGIFLICAESIVYFSPGKSYQKYIRVLIGFMLLMQFMIPIKAILTGQDRVTIENQVNEFRIQLESMSNDRNVGFPDFPSQEDMVEKTIIEEIKSRLNKLLQAEKKDFLVTNVEIGKITSVIVRPQVNSDKVKMNSHTPENISIGNITIDEINIKNTGENINSKKAEELLNLFCQELGTSKEYLEVVIIE